MECHQGSRVQQVGTLRGVLHLFNRSGERDQTRVGGISLDLVNATENSVGNGGRGQTSLDIGGFGSLDHALKKRLRGNDGVLDGGHQGLKNKDG
jgi:hypothetical protein